MDRPLRTTVIGSYPFPGWLEFAAANLDQFGPDDVAEMQDDAVVAALHDQIAAGLDVITDGEQTRLDFNLSFYGISRRHRPGGGAAAAVRPARPRPARQARGDGRAAAPRGLGAVEELRAARSAWRPRGRDAEDERARAVHAQRPAAAQRPTTRTAGR